eukprot:XP_001706369.1 Hypothetical protein GL50803_20003 [Giardia lamblia ATCC 50803]
MALKIEWRKSASLASHSLRRRATTSRHVTITFNRCTAACSHDLFKCLAQVSPLLTNISTSSENFQQVPNSLTCVSYALITSVSSLKQVVTGYNVIFVRSGSINSVMVSTTHC